MLVLRDMGARHPLVDEERDLRFGIVRPTEPGTTQAEVCWRDLGSRFRIDSAVEVDPSTGRQVTVYRTVLQHGWTDAETISGACEPVSSVEIAELYVLVGEAVLVHHHRRTAGGWDQADAVAVIDDRGGRRRVGDFGYRSGADVHDGAQLVAPEAYVDALGWFLRPDPSTCHTGRARAGRPRAGSPRAGSPRAGSPLHTEVHDPAHGRTLRVRLIGGKHRIEIVGGGVEAWSDRLGVGADVVGAWVRAFAGGRYTVDGHSWGRQFVPDGGHRVLLHGRTR